jgi:hypothetical protein
VRPGDGGTRGGPSPLGAADTGSHRRNSGDLGVGPPPVRPADGRDSSAGLSPLGAADTGSYRRGRADPGAGPDPIGTVGTGSPRRNRTDSGAGLSPLGAADTGSYRRGRADAGTGLPPLPGTGGRVDTGSGLSPLTDTDAGRGPRRAGARRPDVVRADTAGATALMPNLQAVPDPDQVTDTGARRARSALRVAAADPAPDEAAADRAADDEEYAEPGVLLQWAIFVAQTLAGGAVGLGVWLGFYRLWSTWPFYAAPAVGAALVVMLVAARALRRRYGRELDLLTALVTVGIGTVLTVLPAAFTLQNLA